MCFTLTQICASLFIGNAQPAIGEQSSTKHDAFVYEGRTIKVIVPDCPLSPNSLQIIPKNNVSNFTQWNESEHNESYDMMQKIVRIWNKRGIHDYMIYGKETSLTPSNSHYRWEIVPYTQQGFRFCKQFSVLWNITFGASCLSANEQAKVASDYQKENEIFSNATPNVLNDQTILGTDAFCNQEIVHKQLVFEGQEINVLYNYAPIAFGKEKLHFLIVPKKHRQGFSDLTESEYREAMTLTQKLVDFYKNKGYHTAYLFNKTGVEAGQTVPHWHEHVVFTGTATQDYLGKLTVLKNMLFSHSPLSKDELESRVNTLKHDLKNIL